MPSHKSPRRTLIDLESSVLNEHQLLRFEASNRLILRQTKPARMIGAPAAPVVNVSRAAYAAPRLSMMPYALVMSAMSVALLFLIRLFVAGSLSLNVFLLSGLGVVSLGLACCGYVAVRSWRAAQGLRQWQMQLETRREWSWE